MEIAVEQGLRRRDKGLMKAVLLAGDIGGTKTNLALFEVESGISAPLAEEAFPSMDPFRRKGRMSKLMEGIPVYVILNPKAALMGAACHGIRTYGTSILNPSSLPLVISELKTAQCSKKTFWKGTQLSNDSKRKT